jgi:hypothetical protein
MVTNKRVKETEPHYLRDIPKKGEKTEHQKQQQPDML